MKTPNCPDGVCVWLETSKADQILRELQTEANARHVRKLRKAYELLNDGESE